MTLAPKLRMKTFWFSDLTVYNTITPTVPPWPPLIQLQKSLIFSRNPFFETFHRYITCSQGARDLHVSPPGDVLEEKDRSSEGEGKKP